VEGFVLPSKFTPESCFPKAGSDAPPLYNLKKCFDVPTRRLGIAMLDMPRGPVTNKDETVWLKVTCIRGRRHWYKDINNEEEQYGENAEAQNGKKDGKQDREKEEKPGGQKNEDQDKEKETKEKSIQLFTL
jgi:hypothetical protein